MPASRSRRSWRRSWGDWMCSDQPKRAGHVVLGALFLRVGEDLFGLAEFDDLAQIHESGEIGGADSLLHVMGDQHDAVIIGQFQDPAPPRGRSRSDRGPSTARPSGSLQASPRWRGRCTGAAAGRPTGWCRLRFSLSLTSSQIGRLAQGPFDPGLHVGLRQFFIQVDAEGDIVPDRQGKRRRLLETPSPTLARSRVTS